MASIAIKSGRLVVGIGEDGFPGTGPSRLEVPLDHVLGAESATLAARRWLDGVRLGGTHIPGPISAGWFRSHDSWAYWEVRDPRRAIRIDVSDEPYDRIVIEVEDPDAELIRIREASPRAGR